MNPHLRIYFLRPDLRHSTLPNLDFKYCLSYLYFKLSIFKLHLLTRLGFYHFLLVYFHPVLFTDLVCPIREGIWGFNPWPMGCPPGKADLGPLTRSPHYTCPTSSPTSVSDTFISCDHLTSSQPPSTQALAQCCPFTCDSWTEWKILPYFILFFVSFFIIFIFIINCFTMFCSTGESVICSHISPPCWGIYPLLIYE